MIPTLKRALSALVGIPGQLELIREAVASYDPDLSKRQAENWHANYLHTKSRFRRALSNLGVAQDAIERFVAGTDIESDHITNHEADLRRQLAESKAAHEYWHDNYVEKVGQLEKQLEAEREAHAEKNRLLDEVHKNWELVSEQFEAERDNCKMRGGELIHVKEQFTQARDDLDALRNTVLGFESMVERFVESVRDIPESFGCVEGCQYSLGSLRLVAHQNGITDESIAAWKAQQKASDNAKG